MSETGRPLRRRVAWIYLAVAVGLSLVPTVVPELDALSLVVLISLPIAMFVGIRRNRPRRLLPWSLVGIAFTLAGVASLLRLLIDPTFAFAHVVSLTGYACVFAGLTGMLRAGGEDNQGALIDGLGVCIGATMAVGCLVTIPAIEKGASDTVHLILVGVYPVASIVVAFLASRLLMSGMRRRPSGVALMVAISGVLIGDLMYALADSGVEVDVSIADIVYGFASILVAFAALHPSMRSLTEPVPRRVHRIGTSRLLVLALAMATPLAVFATGGADSVASRVLLAVGGIVLIILMSVRIAAAVNTHATSERRLLHLAMHDPLTGLPNRLATGQYLALSLEDLPESDAGIAVLYLDLDRFKAVNDTWGAAVGDQLLRDVADRLREFVRTDDFVARIGGDEYIIVATDVPSESAAVEMGIRILESFRRPFALPSGEMTMAASLGVAFEKGDRVVEAEDLLRMADTAMYRAKDLGGGTVARFDDSMRASVARRLQIEAALQRALELDEFTIVYQPIIDLRTEQTVAFEALLRWNCGLLGSVSPVEFIPVAETTGIIRQIGAWVMRMSIAQLAEWRAAGAGDLCLAVNLSACQLEDPDIIEVVLGAARTYGVPTSALWVEITESVLVSDSPRAEAVLPMLRSSGVSIAADDFGTGYSSLSYLKRFPFDHVKIDRTFVNGLGTNTDDEGIVAAVLGMAGALELETVAEGIETELQRDRLRALGCRLAQGYLFDRPLSVDDATARLRAEGVTTRQS